MRGSDVTGFVRFSVPLGARRPRREFPFDGVERLVRRPIERNYDITTFTQDITRNVTIDQLVAGGSLAQSGPQVTSASQNLTCIPPLETPNNACRLFFVDGDGASGTGLQTNPLTVAQATNPRITQPGDILFLLDDVGKIDTQLGTGGSFTLQNNQQLIGVGGATSRTLLNVPGINTDLTVTDSGRPTLFNSGTGDVITLANSNILDGFTIDGMGMGRDGIAGNGRVGGTINDVIIQNVVRDGIHLENWDGIGVTISNTTLTNAARHAIFLSNPTGTFDFASAGANTITHANMAATGDAFHVDGGDANISYRGGITNTVNNAVNRLLVIRNTTGGSVILSGGTLSQANGDGIVIDNPAGSTMIDSDINITGGAGIDLQNGAGDITINGTITVANNTGTAINVQNRTGGTVQLSTVNLNNSGGAGINLTNNMGSFTASGLTTIDGATGIGVDINGGTGGVGLAGITVQNRNNVGIDINGGNQAITLGAVTINNQNSNTNAALNIQDTTGGSVAATSTTIDNNNAIAEGVTLVNNTATVNLGGGSITGAGDTAFRVTQGAANVDYTGSITNAAMRSVQVENRTGGAIALSGTINDTGTGIVAQNNTGGSTTFSGGNTVINTGANQAITLITNPGHTINFTGGGLNVDTTSGNGLGATGGGILNVQGADNTILTTAGGTAVNIDGTTIGSSNATFQSVGATGGAATNGIVLNNTGAGTFLVTGTAVAPDGGTIRSTGTGALITNANASLSNMDIASSGNHGVTVLRNGAGTSTVTLNGNNLGSTSGGAANDGLNGQTTVAGATLNLIANNNILSSTNGDGADINGAGSGTLNINSFSGNQVTSAGGNGISVNTASFNTVNAGATQIGTTGAVGGNGLDFTNVVGNVTFGAGSSIQNTTGTAFNLDNGTATISYGGIITNTSGRSVNIQNRTNGGNITLSGAISDTGAAQGIGILNNVGTNNFNFTGAVDLGTTANRLTGGTALTFTGNSAGITAGFSNLDIATNGQIGINGTTAGSLNITTGALNTTGAGAIGAQLNGITAGITFSSVTVDGIGAGNNALDFTNLAGTFGVTGNTSIGATGAVGTGININGGTAGYTFGGTTIANSTAAGVNVSGTTGG
jgi:hypothetical protein